jgi:hypothetical protein
MKPTIAIIPAMLPYIEERVINRSFLLDFIAVPTRLLHAGVAIDPIIKETDNIIKKGNGEVNSNKKISATPLTIDPITTKFMYFLVWSASFPQNLWNRLGNKLVIACKSPMIAEEKLRYIASYGIKLVPKLLTMLVDT